MNRLKAMEKSVWIFNGAGFVLRPDLVAGSHRKLLVMNLMRTSMHGDLCGIFPSLLNHLNLGQVVGFHSYTIHFVEARVQLLDEITCVPGRTMDA
jgi:hypothetical protein